MKNIPKELREAFLATLKGKSVSGGEARDCTLTAGRAGKVSAPAKVTCAFGDVLEVDYKLTDDSARDVTLTGGAEYVFRGSFEI